MIRASLSRIAPKLTLLTIAGALAAAGCAPLAPADDDLEPLESGSAAFSFNVANFVLDLEGEMAGHLGEVSIDEDNGEAKLGYDLGTSEAVDAILADILEGGSWTGDVAVTGAGEKGSLRKVKLKNCGFTKFTRAALEANSEKIARRVVIELTFDSLEATSFDGAMPAAPPPPPPLTFTLAVPGADASQVLRIDLPTVVAAGPAGPRGEPGAPLQLGELAIAFDPDGYAGATSAIEKNDEPVELTIALDPAGERTLRLRTQAQPSAASEPAIHWPIDAAKLIVD